MNGGLTFTELEELRVVLQQMQQLAPLPDAEIQSALAWFPSGAMREWFRRGNGGTLREIEVLSLAEAMRWRRETLKRNLPSPLSSADRFLPLIRMPAGFLIFDGRADGFALRRTRHPEQYARALERPLRVSELLSLPTIPRSREELIAEEEEEEDDRPIVRRSTRFDGFKALDWRETSLDTTALSGLCDDAGLTDWFSHVGSTTRRPVDKLVCWPLAEALIARDELAERAQETLQAQLHHHRWMPICELPGRHRVVFWKDRGVRLHPFRDGMWHAVPWSRTQRLDTFCAALARGPGREDVDAVLDRVTNLADDDDEVERDFDSSPLEGLRTRDALEAWFSVALSAFARAGEERLDVSAPVDGLVSLLRGDDGIETVLRDGGGVELRVDGFLLPWAPSVTEWVRDLDAALTSEPKPGVEVARNIVGHFTVSLPYLPMEFARLLMNMGRKWQLERLFSISRAKKARLHSEFGNATLRLDDATLTELVNTLDVHNEATLQLEQLGVTFVFKPLK